MISAKKIETLLLDTLLPHLSIGEVYEYAALSGGKLSLPHHKCHHSYSLIHDDISFAWIKISAEENHLPIWPLKIMKLKNE